MQRRAKRPVALLALVLFLLALALGTALEISHHHIHQSAVEDCVVCHQLQAAKENLGTGEAPALALGITLALLAAGALGLASFAIVHTSPTRLKVKLNN